MVLLERRFWEPADPSLPANPNEEMWILEATGEVFGEYSDYLKALYLTKSRVWSSVYTGVSNLTYQEALLEDERGRALARKVRQSHACPIAGHTLHQHLYSNTYPPFLVEQFPKDLEAQALQHVHFGTLRLDDFIEYIYNALKPRQPTGALQGRENDGQPLKLKHPAPRPIIRCWLFEVSRAVPVLQSDCMPQLANAHGQISREGIAWIVHKPACSRSKCSCTPARH